MLHYILQTIAFQLLFLLMYDLFLKRETFFNLNRIYLLLTPVLSLALPFIEIDFIRDQVPEAYIVEIPAVFIQSANVAIELPEVFVGGNAKESSIALGRVIQYAWNFGMACSLLLFLIKIRSLWKLKSKGVTTKLDRIRFVSIPDSTTAFSFFNTVFLGDGIPEQKRSQIVLHEQVHVKEYHSLDLLFFELLRIVFWFNPLIYVYQNRIALQQEYIADAKAVKSTNKSTYYQGLLAQVFQTDKISFINPFFNHSLIKKRIVMLQKSKSKKIAQLRYLMLVPVICSMLVYASCSNEDPSDSEDLGKTELLKKIEAVKKQIEVQGNISEEEHKALKVLALLTSGDFSNPEYKEEVERINLPFGTIEKSAIFPGCEGSSEEEIKACFSKRISEHVGKEFNTKIGSEIGLVGVQKIYTKFIIGKNGKIKDIVVRAPHPKLKEEATRIIESLPQMEPGSMSGQPVGVQYSLPIVFKIEE